ncbi:6-carboxytetrahydropterin synthase [Flammeovirgaceae bacterium SG7u.111]|nr:6-carboxytetrahydropterin synthase [Flammeovirgaceae bacterium SG7u.132]WPO34544.1 6-carboxytetrahydropterin synthase [Flammeovirgaceae bacterium SG7u.111]
MMKICKRFSDIPFAHRQPKHDGHCKLVHGHNWSVELEFESDELDENGFVLDFGKFKKVKKWIADHLDHAIVVDQEDELLKKLVFEEHPELFKPLVVPLPSCEGLAMFLYNKFKEVLEEDFPRLKSGEIRFSAIRMWEDSKNYVVYEPK